MPHSAHSNGPRRIDVVRDTRYWKPYEIFVDNDSVGRFDWYIEISWYFEDRSFHEDPEPPDAYLRDTKGER